MHHDSVISATRRVEQRQTCGARFGTGSICGGRSAMSGPREFVPRSGIRRLAAGQESRCDGYALMWCVVQDKGADDRCNSGCRRTLATIATFHHGNVKGGIDDQDCGSASRRRVCHLWPSRLRSDASGCPPINDTNRQFVVQRSFVCLVLRQHRANGCRLPYRSSSWGLRGLQGEDDTTVVSSMRILVVGAGAIGGYFGGRLHEAGRDVSFLVRPQRARELAQSGLVIVSPAGNATLRDIKTVLAENIAQPFDLVLVSCKAYDLASAMLSFAPAVGPSTAIRPLLNCMRHLDHLDSKFGKSRVLGGQCVIAATLNKEHAIVHLKDMHALTFGERDGGMSERIRAIAAAMQRAKFDVNASEKIVQDMWDKWVFLATLAGAT